MKVRFVATPRREAAREDGLLMRLAPAHRPRRPYWQWYLLGALGAMPLLAIVLWLMREIMCAA